MNARTRGFLCFLCLSAGASVSAANVTVLMFETGLPENAPKIEATSAWESGVMDAFFEAGHIVSNADATMRMNRPGLPASSVGLAEAREGGAEIIVDIVLDYGPVAENTRIRISPRAAEFRIRDAQGVNLYENKKNNLTPTKNGSEDERNAKEIARLLIAQLKKGR